MPTRVLPAAGNAVPWQPWAPQLPEGGCSIPEGDAAGWILSLHPTELQVSPHRFLSEMAFFVHFGGGVWFFAGVSGMQGWETWSDAASQCS